MRQHGFDYPNPKDDSHQHTDRSERVRPTPRFENDAERPERHPLVRCCQEYRVQADRRQQ